MKSEGCEPATCAELAGPKARRKTWADTGFGTDFAGSQDVSSFTHETLALPGGWREPCPPGQTAGQASRQNRHSVFTDSAGLEL